MPGTVDDDLSLPDEDDLLELTFLVPPDRHGWRLDRFLHDRIPRLSRTRIRQVIEEEARSEAGAALKPSHRVRLGETVVLHRPPPVEPETPLDFAVAYEDEDVLVVDKPAGLPVHPTARYHRHTLTWLLRERFGEDRPVLCHRLDRETSGLVVCGKTRQAESALKRQFEARAVSKTYLAVVMGCPDGGLRLIDVPLGPAKGSAVRVRMGPRLDGAGLPAQTELAVVERLHGRALVAARPLTGRQHQIRAHLAHVGHPIVGDKIYGEDEGLFLDFVEQGHTEEALARLELPRHALHAHRVELDHPRTGRRLTVESPLPADLEAYLAARRGCS